MSEIDDSIALVLLHEVNEMNVDRVSEKIHENTAPYMMSSDFSYRGIDGATAPENVQNDYVSAIVIVIHAECDEIFH